MDELSSLTPPPRMMLRDSVYEAIKALLMNHDLTPGSRLSIDGIARELDVSPTPVREAMTKLAADGLVVTRPHAGYVVAPVMDPATLDNLFDIRLLLEPPAARLAAANATERQRADMRTQLAHMSARPAGDTYQSYRDFAVRDANLHRLIAEASGNPLIAEALDRLHAHTHSYRLYFHTGIAEETIAEHGDIVAAIGTGRGDASYAAMHHHLDAARDRLRHAYR